jgi:hypothetical protein
MLRGGCVLGVWAFGTVEAFTAPTRTSTPAVLSQVRFVPSTNTIMTNSRPRNKEVLRLHVATPRSRTNNSGGGGGGGELGENDMNKSNKLLEGKSFWEALAIAISQRVASNNKASINTTVPHASMTTEQDRFTVQLITLLRVGVPSVLAGVASYLLFPLLSMSLATLMNDAGVFAVLSQDSSQFVQNFLTVAGLLFSILVGQTYYFMYQQQEATYYALFNEVTEAKSLLEQVALVCQGRQMYRQILKQIAMYVEEDLKQLSTDPAILLSARPVDDPLESIMYMTSVGVPSSVYETVRSLRQARAGRLGALQRKLPSVHMLLLWLLAAIELMSFPLLGAGTQTIGGYRILTVEGVLFGIMTFAIVMTLRVVGELWRPAGGAYNVDGVLRIMISGLEEELRGRISGSKAYHPATTSKFPSPQYLINMDTDTDNAATTNTDPSQQVPRGKTTAPSSNDSLPYLSQGIDPMPLLVRPASAIWRWAKNRRNARK